MSLCLFLQGVLMFQDQYRAIMQYSVSKESLSKDKIVTDWYCAKVSLESVPYFMKNIDLFHFLLPSAAYSILSDAKIASNAVHPVKKAKRVVKAVTKLAVF